MSFFPFSFFSLPLSQVTPRLEELQLFRLQQESKSFSESVDHKDHAPKKAGREKRKSDFNISDSQSPAKRQKNRAQNPKKGHEKINGQGQNPEEVKEVEQSKSKFGKSEHSNEKSDQRNLIPGRAKGFTDECTAFLSNLNLKVSKVFPGFLFPRWVKTLVLFYFFWISKYAD